MPSKPSSRASCRLSSSPARSWTSMCTVSIACTPAALAARAIRERGGVQAPPSLVVEAPQVGHEVLAPEGDGRHPRRGPADVLGVEHRRRGLDEGDDGEGAARCPPLDLDGLEQLVEEVDVLAGAGLGVDEAGDARRRPGPARRGAGARSPGRSPGRTRCARRGGLRPGRPGWSRGRPLLVVGANRVLEVEDEGVGLAPGGALQQAPVVARHEHHAAQQQRSGHAVPPLGRHEDVAPQTQHSLPALVERPRLDEHDPAVRGWRPSGGPRASRSRRGWCPPRTPALRGAPPRSRGWRWPVR